MFYLFSFSFLFDRGTDHNLVSSFSFAVFLAALLAFLSYKLKFLTTSGIIAASILAVIIFGFGTWKWTVPIFSFFILSSLLSKIRPKRKSDMDNSSSKEDQRNYLQVLANGGFAGLLVIIFFVNSSELFYAAYVSSIAAVCADTWATEIGTWSKFNTYNILNFKKTEQGISGGVSIPGFLGAFAGALIIAFSSLFWIENDPIIFILLILAAGFTGCIIDSILGATVQVKYKCNVCFRTIEKRKHCNTLTKNVKGLDWINNDMVNALSAVSGAFLGYIFTDLILY